MSLDKIITNSTKQNTSRKTNRTSVSEAIPHISCDPMIHCGFHNSLTQVSIHKKRSYPSELETFLADPFNIILSSIPRNFNWFFPSGFPTKTCTCLYPFTPHTNTYILLDMITRITLPRSMDHECPQCSISSTPLHLHPSWIQIYFSAPYLQ